MALQRYSLQSILHTSTEPEGCWVLAEDAEIEIQRLNSEAARVCGSWTELMAEKDRVIEDLKDQLSVKDKIQLKHTSETELRKRILDDTTKNFQALQVRDNETMAVLRQEIQLKHTSETELRNQRDAAIDRNCRLQKEQAERIAELEQRLLNCDKASYADFTEIGRLRDELVDEKKAHLFTAKMLLFLLAAAVLFEIMAFFV